MTNQSDCPADFSAFDKTRPDQDKIELDHLWVPCRLCAKAFQRMRLTRRYCAKCEHAFCEGEHGSFAKGLRATSQRGDAEKRARRARTPGRIKLMHYRLS